MKNKEQQLAKDVEGLEKVVEFFSGVMSTPRGKTVMKGILKDFGLYKPVGEVAKEKGVKLPRQAWGWLKFQQSRMEKMKETMNALEETIEHVDPTTAEIYRTLGVYPLQPLYFSNYTHKTTIKQWRRLCPKCKRGGLAMEYLSFLDNTVKRYFNCHRCGFIEKL